MLILRMRRLRFSEVKSLAQSPQARQGWGSVGYIQAVGWIPSPQTLKHKGTLEVTSSNLVVQTLAGEKQPDSTFKPRLHGP